MVGKAEEKTDINPAILRAKGTGASRTRANQRTFKSTCKGCHGGCRVLVTRQNGPEGGMAQASWWYPEDPGPEHGVWKSNANVLTRHEPSYHPVFGSTEFRALLCKIHRAKDQGSNLSIG